MERTMQLRFIEKFDEDLRMKYRVLQQRWVWEESEEWRDVPFESAGKRRDKGLGKENRIMDIVDSITEDFLEINFCPHCGMKIAGEHV